MLTTKRKIMIARILFFLIFYMRSFFKLPLETVVKRRGITWSLDLKEGIDIAIYLLGGFEVKTLRQYEKWIHEGDAVLDIGANIGAHTLPLAQLVGKTGKVIAFEPTLYAYTKQQKNIALNPHLATRISTHQAMLVAKDSDDLPDTIYSSWPLESAVDLHSDHKGRLMTTKGASKITLDTFIKQHRIEKVDFIKLDVDGNELEVLSGAIAILKKNKPKIMLELAPYVYAKAPHQFDELLNVLWSLGYQISDMVTGHIFLKNVDEIRKYIPTQGGLNVLATCHTS